eukprot:6182283-Pleurochrysis_carterae.AAC.1
MLVFRASASATQPVLPIMVPAPACKEFKRYSCMATSDSTAAAPSEAGATQLREKASAHTREIDLQKRRVSLEGCC